MTLGENTCDRFDAVMQMKPRRVGNVENTENVEEDMFVLEKELNREPLSEVSGRGI